MQHIQTDLDDELLVYNLSVAQISFLDFNQKKKLTKKLDSPHTLALLSIEEIFKLAECGVKKRAVWNGSENLRRAQISLALCKRLGITILMHDEEAYPELLRQIADPPFLLFCRGDVSLLNSPCISVVGTRRLSPEGKEAARSFARDAALAGYTIVSGLAYGADAFAHQGALDAFYDCREKKASDSEQPLPVKAGRTIAVLPCGIDQVVPWNNKKLAAAILECGGCLVSEYGPLSAVAKWQFVARNRIVAGLSASLLVVEAPAGSGALITADFALEDGRDVFFHKAAFNEAAKRISDAVQGQLEKEHAQGRVSRFKLENTPERFLSAGAPVIKDYKDYCIALTECPGQRSINPVQGELFT